MSSIITIAFLICFAGLAALAVKRPAAALAIAAFFLPFETYYNLGVTVTSNELIILALVAGLLLRLIRGEAPAKNLVRISVAFIPFCLALCLSGLFAASFSEAAKEAVRWFSFFALFAVAGLSIRSLDELGSLFKWLVSASVPASLYGIFQSVFGLPSAAFELEPHTRIDSLFCLTTGWHVRAHSFFNQANSFACYQILVLPMSIYLAGRGKTRAVRTFGATALVLNLLALMLTFSRASWPLAIISIVAYFLLSREKGLARPVLSGKRLLWPVIGILLAATIAGLFLKGADISSLLSGYSGIQRLQLYRAGLSLIADRPILGYGPGNYHLAAEGIKLAGDVERLKRAHLHNLYLQVALETGMIGLASFLFFVVYIVGSACRGVRAARSPALRGLAASLCVSSCAFFTYNMIDIYRYHGVHLLAAVIMGSAMALASVENGSGSAI
ncbi:MAG: O-antigen ligase family protein [Candidatus Coatesbacteria bacterium]|nr:O-antigen ligase family protein [Candidatus Coatesbacteria bacterium]